MKGLIRGVVVVVVIAATLLGTVGSVRWAKRGGSAARLMAHALMLGLGMGIVVEPPQQGVEQAEEEADKLRGEADDPLT